MDELCSMACYKVIRIFVEEVTGFRTRGGHPYIDVTDKPFPCVSQRPVWVILEWKPETEFVKSKNQNDITYD